MRAGRELDALVAEWLLEWENNWEKPYGRDFPDMWGTMDFDKNGPIRVPNFPCFSTDIAAWDVVERMEADGWGHRHIVHSPGAENPGCSWMFMKPGQGELSFSEAHAPTTFLAICLAALKAVGHEVSA